MTTDTKTLHVIKGCPREQWEHVQAIQHEPFLYISSNGSKWAGQEEDDLDVLLYVLTQYRLDPERTDVIVNPCVAVDNPNWTWASAEPRWIDGPRVYTYNPVVRFTGNFLNYSHGFSIDTNDPETIAILQTAIEQNSQVKERTAY